MIEFAGLVLHAVTATMLVLIVSLLWPLCRPKKVERTYPEPDNADPAPVRSAKKSAAFRRATKT